MEIRNTVIINTSKKRAKKIITEILLAAFFIVAAAVMMYGSGDLKIIYNFQNGSLTSEDRNAGKAFVVRRGANIIFKIININRFAYKVLINGQVVSNNEKMTSPSKPAQFMSYTEREESPGPKLGESPIGTGESVGPTAPMEQLKNEIGQLGIIKELQSALSESQNIESTYLEFDTKKTNLCNNFMNDNPPKSEVDPYRVIEKCNKIIKKARNTMCNIRINFVKYGESINTEDFLNTFSQLKSLLDEFDKNDYINNIQSILNNVKPENFAVTQTLPSVDTDIVEFSVKIEPIDPRNVASINQLNGPIVVQVKGGWVIDYSTGVFFNMNTNDQDYWFDEGVIDKNKVILKASKKNTISSEVGQLMHIYLQKTANIKWCTLTLGLGTGSADKLSYYLGTGLILGAKNRFLISFGITVVKGNRLLPKFAEIAANGNEIDLPNSDVPIVERAYKIGYFVSLTYNLLGGTR